MYAKLNNGQIEIYPYTIGQLRKDNPNVSFPKNIPTDILASFNVVEVEHVSPPTVSDTEVWHESNPVLDNGVWKQSYTVSNASAEDLASRLEGKKQDLRRQRDQLLKDSDWTQVADAPVDKQVWATYRQALRDLPQADGFPNVNLPASPMDAILGGNTDGN